MSDTTTTTRAEGASDAPAGHTITVIVYTCPDCGHTTNVAPDVTVCAGCGRPLPVIAEADARPPAWAAAYFQDCRELLGIGADWQLWLAFVNNPSAEADGSDDDANEADGVCSLETRYLKATIRIRRGLSEERTRYVIMHELLHVALAPLSLTAERMRDLIPFKLWTHVLQLYTDAEEQTIERLTRALQRGVRLSAEEGSS